MPIMETIHVRVAAMEASVEIVLWGPRWAGTTAAILGCFQGVSSSSLGHAIALLIDCNRRIYRLWSCLAKVVACVLVASFILLDVEVWRTTHAGAASALSKNGATAPHIIHRQPQPAALAQSNKRSTE
jgi:hypothetical protein